MNIRNNFCTHHVLPRFELGIFMYWTCNPMNNLLSYCGLVDAEIRACDKDFPVTVTYFSPVFPVLPKICRIFWAIWRSPVSDSSLILSDIFTDHPVLKLRIPLTFLYFRYSSCFKIVLSRKDLLLWFYVKSPQQFPFPVYFVYNLHLRQFRKYSSNHNSTNFYH